VATGTQNAAHDSPRATKRRITLVGEYRNGFVALEKSRCELQSEIDLSLRRRSSGVRFQSVGRNILGGQPKRAKTGEKSGI
jgi:hypothetical protein